ncbi:hypothetical protein [Mycolicibacterium sp. lyk4-40-TYG-92]|uniref:hypothetical protein n=1 Tax=Mycolicibacterium sp. lyk4-40-TYG-92 TaxID=3040295 RepID=UPI00254A6B6B|nr:hypothetical protein [Mycolicibacterium sp. lyk4-40-TYG-92]
MAFASACALPQFGRSGSGGSTDSTTALPSVTIAPAAADGLMESFAALAQSVKADVGLAIGPTGAAVGAQVFGHWTSGPAWSTSKVPVVMAAMRDQHTATPTTTMSEAITASDNAAAEQIWANLGEPEVAAQKVDAILREAGDQTVVQARRTRPEYSAFGQTIWPLADQERFLAMAACDSRNASVLDLMAHIEVSQHWGLGTIQGTSFKGGWGPSPAGKYLVRQFGIIRTPAGALTVAVAAEPATGSFDDGVIALNAIANWIAANLRQWPAGHC